MRRDRAGDGRIVLVTGATGFLGTAIVKALRERFPGDTIRLFDVRAPAGPLAAGVELVSGSITDPDLVARATAGVDVVLHLAALVDPQSRDVDDLRTVNVEGTRVVFEAAVSSGTALFVQMSSAGVYGHPRATTPFRETDATQPASPYQRSKHDAEQVMLSVPHGRTIVNILRPAGIYGAGSRLELPTFRTVQRRRWSVEMKGGVVVHPTHVTDVVSAMLAVIEQPAPHGTVMNVGGDTPVLLQDLLAEYARALGVSRRRVVIPPMAAGPLARVASPILALLGRRSAHLVAFCRGQVVSAAVDDSAFRARYPHVPRKPLAEGVREQVSWARANALL
jgi:nucleoside-diphosphate-sugar epimerase